MRYKTYVHVPRASKQRLTHWEHDKSFVHLTGSYNISRSKVRLINFSQQARARNSYLLSTKSFIALLQTLMYLCVQRVTRTLKFPFRNAYCAYYSKRIEETKRTKSRKLTKTTGTGNFYFISECPKCPHNKNQNKETLRWDCRQDLGLA